jgi:hypothetical protein
MKQIAKILVGVSIRPFKSPDEAGWVPHLHFSVTLPFRIHKHDQRRQNNHDVHVPKFWRAIDGWYFLGRLLSLAMGELTAPVLPDTSLQPRRGGRLQVR